MIRKGNCKCLFDNELEKKGSGLIEGTVSALSWRKREGEGKGEKNTGVENDLHLYLFFCLRAYIRAHV